MPDFRWKLKYQSSYEAPTSTGGGEFTNESKTKREYKDFVIETDSYALMTKPMYERLIEIADRYEESVYPEKRYRKHGRYVE